MGSIVGPATELALGVDLVLRWTRKESLRGRNGDSRESVSSQERWFWRWHREQGGWPLCTHLTLACLQPFSVCVKTLRWDSSYRQELQDIESRIFRASGMMMGKYCRDWGRRE